MGKGANLFCWSILVPKCWLPDRSNIREYKDPRLSTWLFAKIQELCLCIHIHWIIYTIIYRIYNHTHMTHMYIKFQICTTRSRSLHIFDGHPVITCGAWLCSQGPTCASAQGWTATTSCPLSCRNDLTDSTELRAGPDGSALRGYVPTSHSPLRWDAWDLQKKKPQKTSKKNVGHSRMCRKNRALGVTWSYGLFLHSRWWQGKW